jgi:DNA excision repair protein ERCC-2
LERPWQDKIIARIVEGRRSGQRRWIVDAPAGSGKTRIATELSKRWSTSAQDLKTYVAVRTINEMTPYDETNRRFNLGLEMKYWIGKRRLCDVYEEGDDLNADRCDFDLQENLVNQNGAWVSQPARKKVDTSGLASQYSHGLQSIYDLKITPICPYVSNRHRIAPFNVITYNHILNAGIRRRAKIDLSRALLIVDEAHNLETAAGRTVADLNVAYIEGLAEKYAKVFGPVQRLVTAHGGIGSIPVPRTIQVAGATAALKEVVERCSQGVVDDDHSTINQEDARGKDTGRTRAQKTDKASLTKEVKSLYFETQTIRDASAAIETARNVLMLHPSSETVINPFRSLIKFVSELLDDEDQNALGLFSNRSGSISLKPVDPTKTLEVLNDARWLVLMSGTMPTKDYVERVWGISGTTEISVLRDYNREYRKVFPEKNLVLRLTEHRSLKTNFEFRKKRGESLWRAYAQFIDRTHQKYARSCTLVCVPSYPIASEIFRFLRTEPRFIEERHTSIETLKRKIIDEIDEKRRAIVVAVARGKLLEGVELVNHGKSLIDVVIIAGIPYPVPDDIYRVRRDHLLQRLGILKDSKEAKAFERTYLMQQPALTAVKQAIGRAIRNPEDKAMVFLCDYRFRSSGGWRKSLVREEEKVGETF